MSLIERLKYARNSLNLTLNVVEGLTGIGISTLSDFENGKREPKLGQLKKLADAYRRPISYFLDEGELVPELVLWRQKPTSPRAEELQTLLVSLAETYHNLELICGEVRPYELPSATGDAERFGYSEAAKLARRVRDDLGLGNRPGQTLLRVLEEVCQIKVFHLSFEPTGSAACTVSAKSGAAILLNAKNVRWRRNFDLAHELFHLLTWKFFRKATAADILTPSSQEEKLATCFARNLLMPQESLREAVDAQRGEKGKLSFDDLFEIARQFDVSVEALLWHIGFVYSIDSTVVQQQIDRLRGQISFWDERERDTPSERPLRFRALARQALRRGLISTGRYAEYLGITRREAMQVVEQDAEEDVEVEVAHP